MNILSGVIYIFKLFNPYIYENYINDIDLIEKGLYFDVFSYKYSINSNNNSKYSNGKYIY